jgi:hypothetical protein
VQMSEEQLQAFASLPVAETCRLIDFENIEIAIFDSMPPQIFLTVTGVKPYVNMVVTLIPRVYVRQPEYWGIELVGCMSGLGLSASTPYTVSISLNGVTGTMGIEVIGATKSEKKDVLAPPQQWIGEHQLFRRWLHSFEEDTNDAKVYRPVEFAFPPARGRDGFEIKESGVFIRLDIAPADGIKEVSGHWEVGGLNKIVVRFDDPQIKPETLSVVELCDDILQIRP